MKYAHLENNTNKILGWYDEEINPVIPTPNIEITDEVWQEALSINANCYEDGKFIVKDFRTEEEIQKQKLIDELQTQLKSYRDYLNETSWIWDKYQRNCVTLKNISEDSFNEAYKDIIEKQEFARNEIKRIETQLGLTPEISLDIAKQEKISELKVKRDFIIDSAIENVQVKKSTDRENIQGTIQYFEVLSQGNSTIGWTMEDNSVKELSKDDLQRVLDSYVVRKAQAFAEYQYNKQQVDECMTIDELDSLKLN